MGITKSLKAHGSGLGSRLTRSRPVGPRPSRRPANDNGCRGKRFAGGAASVGQASRLSSDGPASVGQASRLSSGGSSLRSCGFTRGGLRGQGPARRAKGRGRRGPRPTWHRAATRRDGDGVGRTGVPVVGARGRWPRDPAPRRTRACLRFDRDRTARLANRRAFQKVPSARCWGAGVQECTGAKVQMVQGCKHAGRRSTGPSSLCLDGCKVC